MKSFYKKTCFNFFFLHFNPGNSYHTHSKPQPFSPPGHSPIYSTHSRWTPHNSQHTICLGKRTDCVKVAEPGMEQWDLAQLPPNHWERGNADPRTHTRTQSVALLKEFIDYLGEVALGSKGSGGSSWDDHLLMPLEGKRTPVFPQLPILKDKT